MPRKKLSFSKGNLRSFQIKNFKNRSFDWVTELSKSNQPQYGVSSVYTNCKTRKIFDIACLGKKLFFQTEICDYFKSLILKYSIFDRVKELSKSSQTRYGAFPVYIGSITKKKLCNGLPRKKVIVS